MQWMELQWVEIHLFLTADLRLVSSLLHQDHNPYLYPQWSHNRQTHKRVHIRERAVNRSLREHVCDPFLYIYLYYVAIPFIQTSLYCIFTHYWHFFSSRDASGSSPTTSSCHHSLSPFYTNKHRYAPTSHGIYHRLENFHVKNSLCKNVSWFKIFAACLICEILLTVDSYNMDKRLELSKHVL